MKVQFLLTRSLSLRLYGEFRSSSSKQKQDILQLRRNFKRCIHHFFPSARAIKDLKTALPLVYFETEGKNPGDISVNVLCLDKGQLLSPNYFFDLMQSRLLSGKKIAFSSFHQCEIKEPTQRKTLCFFSIDLLALEEMERGKTDVLPIIKILKEALLSPNIYRNPPGESHFDQKALQIHTYLIRFAIGLPPQDKVYLWQDSALFQSRCATLFKQVRSASHLARIITTVGFLRKKSAMAAKTEQTIFFRLFPSSIYFTFGCKKVLSLVILVNHFEPYQVFDEKSIVRAVDRFVPQVRAMRRSYLHYAPPDHLVHVFYLELNKEGEQYFTTQEINLLKKHLQRSLETSIEKVVPALFLKRNEEETVKNIVMLSHEFDANDNFPQAMIAIDSQNEASVTFNVIYLRAHRPINSPVSALFNNLEEGIEYFPEPLRIIDEGCEAFAKEVNVFRLNWAKTKFPSLIYPREVSKYHQVVVEFLTSKLGPFRDCANGKIGEQNPQIIPLKKRFSSLNSAYPTLLDEFFYSLTPVEMQTTLPFLAVATLFEQCLTLIQSREQGDNGCFCHFKKHETNEYAYLALSYAQKLNEDIPFYELDNLKTIFPVVSTKFVHEGCFYCGFLYLNDNPNLRTKFYDAILSSVKYKIFEKQNQQILRLNLTRIPLAWDPRVHFDLSVSHVFKLLFDGLLSIDTRGEMRCEAAESYDLSLDQRFYTFHLRESYWSNGDRVTSYDFSYAWKKILSPEFKTSFSYNFKSIKNAPEVKNGKLPVDEVGIYVPTSSTLVVELTEPDPIFLKYLTLTLFSPINHRTDHFRPDWSVSEEGDYVCNGAFTLSQRVPGEVLALEKNTYYWNKEKVELKEARVYAFDDETALKKYQEGMIDWLGRPLMYWIHDFAKCKGDFGRVMSTLCCWLKLNINAFPFYNKKFRQAFLAAIDQEELVHHLLFDATPTSSLFDDSVHSSSDSQLLSRRKKARELFREALEEMKIPHAKFPAITVNCSLETKKFSLDFLKALQKQIKDVLGICLLIEFPVWNHLFNKMLKETYQTGIVRWSSINFPYDLFNLLEGQTHEYDLYKWRNEKFSVLWKKIKKTQDTIKRSAIMQQIEELFVDEVPLIPLYRENSCYIKQERLQNISQAPGGFFDFRKSTIIPCKASTNENIREILKPQNKTTT